MPLRLVPLILCFMLQFRPKDLASSQSARVDYSPPTRRDFDTCKLKPEFKENFLDEHNRFRGMVNPPAADMEYLLWDDDLANLAQMWVNKCLWPVNGFLKFGEEYPHPVNFTSKLMGQSLARDFIHLVNPVDRLEIWYNESYYYTYSKYGTCSKAPCGHYIQMSWATLKYVGCAVHFCTNFGNNGGGSFVACDYDKMQIVGRYPYQQGTPCSKCASGKGFCYKNLCRDCADFDQGCGTTLSLAMCTSDLDLMEKKCPKTCNLCKCPLKCQNGGTLNLQNCVCSCPTFWTGMDCSEPCKDTEGRQFCLQQIKWKADCKASYMKKGCAASCGYCGKDWACPPGDDGSGTFTTTVAPATTTAPKLPPTPVNPTTAAPISPVTKLPAPTTPAPQGCSSDRHATCEMWAAVGECEKNPQWMLPNCCVSCKYHQAPKDCSDLSSSCPRWAYFDECQRNREWMTDNCRKSCNQCGDCKDTDAKCSSWALQKQCSSGDRVTWMNTKCRESCGLCRVYDRHAECPAWSVMGECGKTNWTWMADHCPRSCDVPVSEALFCGGKPDGNYQAPTSCEAYIACSHGVTSHVACPPGEKFDTVKRICDSADQATCTVVNPSKKTTPTWNIIWTLKRG